MMDDLDHLKSVLDGATPQPDSARKTAHLALAQRNFEALQTPKPQIFARLRQILSSRIVGTFATYGAVCIGALFIVMPETHVAPQPQPAIAETLAPRVVVDTANDLFADRSMAEAPAELAATSLGQSMPVAVKTPLLEQISGLFVAPSVSSIPSPWDGGVWLVFVATNGEGTVTFNSNMTARMLGATADRAGNFALDRALQVFAVSPPAFDGAAVSVGLFVDQAGKEQPVMLGSPATDASAVRFAAAVAGFTQIALHQEPLGVWNMADAIALAKANLGADMDGLRASIVTQMRLIAAQ